MTGIASQITSLTIVYSTVYSKRRSKKTPKPGVTGPLWGVFNGDRWIPRPWVSNAENVSIWWRHYEFSKLQLPDIETVECDVRDWDATRRLVEGLGDIHLLVNNAGVAGIEDALTATPESFDKYVDQSIWQVQPNSLGPLLLTWFNFNQARISNYFHHKVCDKITCPKLQEWINNFIPHATGMGSFIHAGIKLNPYQWKEPQESLLTVNLTWKYHINHTSVKIAKCVIFYHIPMVHQWMQFSVQRYNAME